MDPLRIAPRAAKEECVLDDRRCCASGRWLVRLSLPDKRSALAGRHALDLYELVDHLLELIAVQLEFAPKRSDREATLLLEDFASALELRDEAHESSSSATRSACPVAPISV